MRTRRVGFTILELIIVIAILAILLALLLPAIQAARQAAFKNSSRNNLKQIALAVQNHIDTYKTLPPLYFTAAPATGDTPADDPKNEMNPLRAEAHYSWQVRLLPFMEEDALYKSISAAIGNSDPNAKRRFQGDSRLVKITNPAGGEPISPAEVRIQSFISPIYKGAETAGGKEPYAVSNYFAIAATTTQKLTNGKNDGTYEEIGPDGVIIPGRGARGLSIRFITDGTSKTAIIAESNEGAQGPYLKPRDDYAFSWYKPTHSFVCAFAPGQGTTAEKPRYNNNEWEGLDPDICALNFGPSPISETRYSGDQALTRDYGPSSNLAGEIVIHAMGDGSVQEFSSLYIDAEVYYALITARGGENFEWPQN